MKKKLILHIKKKNVLNEYTLVKQKMLPKDVYLCWFTYALSEYFTASYYSVIFSTGLLLCFTFLLLNVYFDNIFLKGSGGITCCCLIFFYLPISCDLFIRNKLSNIDQRVKIELLSELIKIDPGCNTAAWNKISLYMNDFMFQYEFWPSRNFFFDGESCHIYFQDFGIAPYIDDVDYSNQSQCTTVKYQNQNMISSIYTKTQEMKVSNFGLECYIEWARNMYKASIEKSIQDISSLKCVS